MSISAEVTWDLDGISMYATLTRPGGDGPFPAVALVAGSGPTDRDWNSPLLPGQNGSARLLAEVLADAGIAALRYDKRASGPHVRENLPALAGKLDMRSHLDELVAAVAVLAGRDFVDAARVVGLGNSEGCVHLMHYATSEQAIPLAGIILAGPPGRPISQLLLAQLTLQLGSLPDAEDLLSKVEAAARRYSSGQPMDPDPGLPEPVKLVLQSFDAPANLPFARELWATNTPDLLTRVDIPALILIGRKDLQVDAHADGGLLQSAAQGKMNISFAFPANANHVLKEDVRSAAAIAAAPGTGYNEPGTHLDPEAVATILSWLVRVVA